MLVVVDESCECILLQDLHPPVTLDFTAVHEDDQSQKKDDLHSFFFQWVLKDMPASDACILKFRKYNS